ncbi:hypothetical protein PPUJ20028_46820 [Pseudomonas putida]|uniref:Uncharacterized protein n=1 Tax=Pseudomonas putida TaxID=303 RepID=A0AA37RC78_PSEPU|nr:hypothetical protein PPUJ20028_46820 [Pseudomonas putida]GLO37845.1 hypothetical protein PPUN14671_46820 [Pseudomonas putida]
MDATWLAANSQPDPKVPPKPIKVKSTNERSFLKLPILGMTSSLYFALGELGFYNQGHKHKGVLFEAVNSIRIGVVWSAVPKESGDNKLCTNCGLS